MKRIILLFAALLFAAVSLNAQISNLQKSCSSVGIYYKNGNLYQNGVKLSSSQVLDAFGPTVYKKQYKPAKCMRTAGIVLFSTGAAATAMGTGLMVSGLIEANKQDPNVISGVFGIGFGIISTVYGAGVATAGGLLWGFGNKKMKKIVPASNGAWIALAF